MPKIFSTHYSTGQGAYTHHVHAHHEDGTLGRITLISTDGKESKVALSFLPGHVQEAVNQAVINGEGLIIN